MIMTRKKIKSEHSGAKNGGGHWGTRDDAKVLSKKVRRESNKNMIRKESVRILEDHKAVEPVSKDSNEL